MPAQKSNNGLWLLWLCLWLLSPSAILLHLVQIRKSPYSGVQLYSTAFVSRLFTGVATPITKVESLRAFL